jgi:hypothetical protein
LATTTGTKFERKEAHWSDSGGVTGGCLSREDDLLALGLGGGAVFGEDLLEGGGGHGWRWVYQAAGN